MPFRTGNSSTPVIITNKGTQQRTALPNAHPCRKVGRSVSKRATKGSQQWANTTKKQAVTRSKSIHPMFSLLLCAKKRNIEFIKHGNHRIPVESFIPVKAFFDDCNKELTIEFAQDWEAVTIEIKSKEGYVVYRNLYIPHSNSSLSTSLENIPAGIYELTITDEKGILAGEFIYEN